MTDSTTDSTVLNKRVRQMALEGKNITTISKELGISWNEAYTLGWLGAKVRITNRLKKLAKETNAVERKKLTGEVDSYVDFTYDAAKHLRSQVENARKALNR